MAILTKNGLLYTSRSDMAEMLNVSHSTISRMINDNIRKIEQDDAELYCMNDIPRCAELVRQYEHQQQLKQYDAIKEQYNALQEQYETLQQENEQNKAKILDAKLHEPELNTFVQYIKSKTVAQSMMLFIIVATLFITFYEVVHLPKFQNLETIEMIAYLPILLFSVTMSVAVVWTAFNKSSKRTIDNLTLFVFVGVEFSSSANFFGLNEVLQQGTFLQMVITLFLSIGLPTLSIRLANSKASTNRQLSVEDAVKAFKKANKGSIQAVNQFKQYLIN